MILKMVVKVRHMNGGRDVCLEAPEATEVKM
jgi:hypothetical protein